MGWGLWSYLSVWIAKELATRRNALIGIETIAGAQLQA
jgi:hypothetical protein